MVLKRILDKKTSQHANELDEIDSIRKNIPDGDGVLVDEYKRRLIEKREDVILVNPCHIGIESYRQLCGPTV